MERLIKYLRGLKRGDREELMEKEGGGAKRVREIAKRSIS
jgi:hypothetical protein